MKNREKTIVIGVRLRIPDKRLAEEIARRQRRPLSSYLRLVIERDLSKRKGRAA